MIDEDLKMPWRYFYPPLLPGTTLECSRVFVENIENAEDAAVRAAEKYGYFEEIVVGVVSPDDEVSLWIVEKGTTEQLYSHRLSPEDAHAASDLASREPRGPEASDDEASPANDYPPWREPPRPIRRSLYLDWARKPSPPVPQTSRRPR